jgi:hypothetical protein
LHYDLYLWTLTKKDKAFSPVISAGFWEMDFFILLSKSKFMVQSCQAIKMKGIIKSPIDCYCIVFGNLDKKGLI